MLTRQAAPSLQPLLHVVSVQSHSEDGRMKDTALCNVLEKAQPAGLSNGPVTQCGFWLSTDFPKSQVRDKI